MKKILLILMLLVVGSLSFAISEEAKITVRATLVDEELVIGGVNNKPMIIDFGNIENSSNGKLDFVVQYTGIDNTLSKIDISLDDGSVNLTNQNNNSLVSNINLVKNSDIIKGKKGKVVNSIKGNVNKIAKLENGLYEGITQLNITVIPM